ncbi:MAG: fluoride efflux transporter CrcB [Paracoccaceae bacterium]|jgi:CrcB protein
MFSLTTLAQVAAGGAIGASARYLVNITSGRLFGTGFPIGTLTVNVAGSFLMGLLVVVLAEKSGNRLAPFLMTGILGGFTTFSAFSLDTITLWERGQTGLAAAYVLASVILSLAAILLALHLFRGAFA